MTDTRFWTSVLRCRFYVGVQVVGLVLQPGLRQSCRVEAPADITTVDINDCLLPKVDTALLP